MPPPATTVAGAPPGTTLMDPHPALPPDVVSDRPDLAIVIPAYNECDAIVRTIDHVRAALAGTPWKTEVLVVDDGSTDGTGERARAGGANVLSLPENGGYGAAIKAGLRATSADLIVIMDADGTYPAESIPRLVERAGEADMVVGARRLGDSSIPLERRPAKWFLTRLASYLAGRRIPDLNSGLRLLRRRPLQSFLHLLPAGFSFTTTITLCFLCTHHPVVYEPIAYHPRIGSSKIRAVDFPKFLMLVLRTVVLFNPLKVFLPLGALMFAAGVAKFVYDVFKGDLSESAVMAFLTAVVVWSVGLLADMIARLQLRPPGAA